MTKNEKYWILNDVGNSAFIMLVSTIIPIYFKNIASTNGISDAMSTSYWGYSASIATLIVAIIGPILGAIGDNKGFKKKLFALFSMLGIVGCACLSVPATWIGFLTVFIVAKVGYSASLIFYDSMLCDITPDENMDSVSSHGYAWGYIGSCVPFILCLGLILTANTTGIGTERATKIAFIITAIWWIACCLPLLKNYKQVHYVKESKNVAKESLARLSETLRSVKQNKSIFLFLVAFFLYIDGVYTIIEMATSYGKDVGISDNNLLLALLLTQIIAFPCAIIVSKIVKKYEATKLIKISIIGYFFIAVFALQLDRAWEFWFLAVCVAVFQGGIQALSRSYFAKIVPKEQSNEYFGLFDIFGKGAAFTGTFLVGFITQITGHSRYGVGAISVLFLIGYFVFDKHLKVSNKQEVLN